MLAATARRQLPQITQTWLTPARQALQALTTLALDPTVTDADFLTAVRSLEQEAPRLLEQIDAAPLATHLQDTLAAALANGLAARLTTAPPRPITAKLVQATPCGDSNIPEDHECHKGLSATVQRYRKGVSIISPTGRRVEFGGKLAGHMEKDWAGKDPARLRLASKAEDTVRAPDEVYQHGSHGYHFKNLGKLTLLVITDLTDDGGQVKETASSYYASHPRRLDKKKRGQKLWPP